MKTTLIEKDLLLILGILGICALSLYFAESPKDILMLSLGGFIGALKGKV